MTTTHYLAGSMARAHRHHYADAAKKLRSYGLAVTNPAELPTQAGQPWSHALRANLRAMLDCDTVILIRGWRDSEGAQLERTVALKVGIPVIDYADVLATLRRAEATTPPPVAVRAGGRARPGVIGGAR